MANNILPIPHVNRPHHTAQGQPTTSIPPPWMSVDRRNGHMLWKSDHIVDGLMSPPVTGRDLPSRSPVTPSFPFSNIMPPPISSPTPLPPQQILRSQGSPKPCVACGRSTCRLVSHHHFATTARTRHKSRRPSMRAPLSTPQTPARSSSTSVQYPVIMDLERQYLLSLWSHDWSPVRRGPERHQFPVRWIDLVLPAALRHAPLFQTLLATAASLSAATNNPHDELAHRHTQIAIQMLTQTCNDHETASTDESILASTLLTLVYLSQGNTHEIERQFNVLVQVVESRGGPHYLGLSGTVAELLLHADHTQAVFLDRQPAFRMSLPALDVEIDPRLGEAFRISLCADDLDQSLLLAAGSLSKTTDVFELLLEKSVTVSGVMNSFGYLSNISEYQLARCHAMLRGSGGWDECVCLALLLFNQVVLHAQGTIDEPVRKLEHDFWSAIETLVGGGGFRDIPPCLLLWLLMTGLTPCIYAECQYRMNAVEKMRTARISAAIHGWDQLRTRVLDRHVWLRAAQEDVFRDIWHEVEDFKVVIGSST